jgi:hydrocephalus-inducing protein
MPAFSEELVVDVCGMPFALATLTGACTAAELSLASDSVPFGTVVLGSRTSKRLALSNTGDVGVHFAWDSRALGPHFVIVPPGAWLL